MLALLRCALLSLAVMVVGDRCVCAETSNPPPPSLSPEERLERVLEQPAAFDFREATLEEVVQQINQQFHVPATLDRKELEQASVSGDTTVTMQLRSGRLATLLHLLLEPYDLAFTTTDGVLEISTREKVCNQPTIGVYNVLDLVRSTPGEPADEWDYVSLQDLIVESIQPDSWDENGGKGTLSAYDGMLSVAQTRDVQAGIKSLLRELRKVRCAERGNIAADRSVGLTAGAKALRTALETPVALDVKNVTLAELVRLVSQKCSISVEVDDRELEDANVGRQTLVSCPLPAGPLRSVLRQALAEYELDIVACDDVLLITSAEKASCSLTTVVYPVADLLATTGSAAPDAENFVDLISTMVNSCSPDSWDENGGKSTIRPFPIGRCLVISQTENVHRQINDLAAQLRQQRGERLKEDESAANQPLAATIKTYHIVDSSTAAKESVDRSAATAQDVARVVTAWVHVAGWTADENTLQVIGSRLVIKAPPAVHREIKKLIKELEVSAPTGASRRTGRGQIYGCATCPVPVHGAGMF